MLWEILKASKGILVADFYADLWANIFVEMIGSLPLYYNGKGYDLTDYLISGNAVQDGTPSADAPVDAVGCGVRTRNLFDFKQLETASSGTIEGARFSHLLELKLKANTYYTMGSNGTGSTDSAPADLYRSVYFNTKTGEATVNRDHPVTVLTDSTGVVRIGFVSERTNAQQYLNGEAQLWINEGDTLLPYEPYGYKLPLTVNGTEYPIYLGTVPTTRRIGKFDLSELSWTRISNGLWKTTGIPNIKYVSANTEVGDGIAEKYAIHAGAGMSTAPGYIAIDVSQVSVNTGDASETPTGMFWYVLAEPETGIVNEPLMKIGDYADTISFAQSGVTIPTVNGENVLDMTSPVKPSEMYIKGKGIKPTGDRR